MSHGVPSLVAVGLLLLSYSSAFAEQVGTCGMVVSDGVLTSDLDCSANPYGVSVRHRGLLDLAGHTLIPGQLAGVACERDCTIVGNGGAIRDGAQWGIIDRERRSRVAISGVTISGNGSYGVAAGGKITVTDSEISGNNYGIGFDGSPKKVSISRSRLIGNRGSGISALFARVDISDSEISGNGINGVQAHKVFATSSVIVNNGGDDHCLTFPLECVDLASAAHPSLFSVTCDTSADLTSDAGFTEDNWGVCTLD